MNTNKIFLALAIFNLSLFTFHLASAQEEGGYNESVVVRGSYRPVIERSEKMTFPAEITDTQGMVEHTFNYGINPARLRSLYEPTRIKAARIVGEPATKLYNNYLRLGMGNYWSPLADLYYHSTRNKNYSYGTRLLHASSWGSIGKDSVGSPDYYGKNHFSTTDLSVYGKYIYKEDHLFQSSLSYNNDYHMY